MKIFLDNIIYSLQNVGGISTYWGELSKRMLRDGLDVNFIERDNRNIVRNSLDIPKIQIFQILRENNLIQRFNSLPLTSLNEKFIFHSSYNRITTNNNAKQITTVHDFVHEKYYGGLRKWLHSYQKNKSIYTAQKIIAVSQNTKNDLLSLHPKIDPKNIEVIYNGVSDDFYIIDKVKNTNKPYFLFIGSREHYKNFSFVVNLIRQMADYDLYIVGKFLSKQERQLVLRNIPGRYKLFHNISNTELNLLYNKAFALLYPSSYEGFGIPLLEAMKAGLPFIALNRSSIPEVAGNAGELVGELDIDGFKVAINKVANNRMDYILKGLKQADFFSWEKCYLETMKLYRKSIDE